ncbi:hypothetical protein [Pseudomonas sp. TWI628]|uniref:hypothetical protein n=1 Tax=Pseudomonas sp. TWI628 TaxID=3136788 RepID=UPI00320A0C6C
MSNLINGVDFDRVTAEAITAARGIIRNDWPRLQACVEMLGRGMANDARFLKRQLEAGALDHAAARTFLEDRKIVARLQLRALAIITLQLAEDILDAMTAVFTSAINRMLGWDLL